MSTEEVKVAGGAADNGAVEEGAVEAGAAGAADGTVDGGAVADGEAVKPARPKQRRMRDMAFSMAVLLVPIGLFYVGWEWLASDRQVSVVDTTENHATAASLGLAAIEPELSDEWKPISTDLAVDGETVTLRTGWYSPDGHGLQVAETNGAVADVDEDLTGAGTPVEAAGIEWAAYESGTGETWVAELDGETIVLSAEPDGAADLPELAEGVAEATGV